MGHLLAKAKNAVSTIRRDANRTGIGKKRRAKRGYAGGQEPGIKVFTRRGGESEEK